MSCKEAGSIYKNKRLGVYINPIVFFVSAGLVVLFVAFSLLFLKDVSRILNATQQLIAEKSGWFYILTVNVCLVYVCCLLFGRFGKIRLGGQKARPDFSVWSWFAMLFSAGMGIGLLFYGVAEPIWHFSQPPVAEPGSLEAARQAINFTFVHWGLHGWVVYAIVGLALAFFSFNRGLPLSLRSVFYPIIGDRIHGFWGNLIDIVAVVATLFGVATSLGLGAQQINSGLHHLFNLTQNIWVQIGLIVVITGFATTSVVLGLDRGIRRLSEFNMLMGLALMGFVLILGPTVFLLDSVIQNIGYYAQHLLEVGTWNEAYTGTQWQNNWTIFYYAWWIAWSPFVGMFIARISRGRTVREFLLGVLFVPTTLTFLWMGIFGNAAIYESLFGSGEIAKAVNENFSTALFVLLADYPLAKITSFLAIIVVVTFFVTSSDSCSLVIDIITAGGHTNPPVKQRIFWSFMEGLVAIMLLLGGGNKAMQTALIVTGLPFAAVILVMLRGLYMGLKQEWLTLYATDAEVAYELETAQDDDDDVEDADAA